MSSFGSLALLGIGAAVGVVFVVLGGMMASTIYEEQDRVHALSNPSAPPRPPAGPPPPAPPPHAPPTHCGDWTTYSAGGGALAATNTPCESECNGQEGSYATGLTTGAEQACLECRFQCCCYFCDGIGGNWDPSFDLSTVVGCELFSCDYLEYLEPDLSTCVATWR